MHDITSTFGDLEKVACIVLKMDSAIDLGPAPEGGRHCCELVDGLSELLSRPELKAVIEDALVRHLEQNRDQLRSGLARWIRRLYVGASKPVF